MVVRSSHRRESLRTCPHRVSRENRPGAFRTSGGMTRFAATLRAGCLLLAMLAVASCARQAASDGTVVGMEEALAIARAAHEAESPSADALFEEGVVVRLVTLPGRDAPVYQASFVVTVEGDDAPTERHYFIAPEDGTILDVQ
jgi:hypothetical protein